MITDIVNYLGFGGNCEAAFKFYETALDGKIIALFRYKDAPAGTPYSPDAGEQIMHITLQIGDKLIQGGDAPSGMFNNYSGFCINLVNDDVAAAEKYFNALSVGGKINMPFAETFWAERFGMVIDKFGVPWMINCPKPL